MLTAKGDPVDRIIGLELGADDYVPKPCPPRELAARLNAILRRTANMPSAIAPVVAGPLTINPSRREATANGIVIDLTGTELTLLEVLARKVGTPVPKDRDLPERCSAAPCSAMTARSTSTSPRSATSSPPCLERASRSKASAAWAISSWSADPLHPPTRRPAEKKE